MANLIEHAKRELGLINIDGDEMQNAMDCHILKMVEIFAEEGHSNHSAKYAISALTRLLNYKPLKPLTGEDSEWHETSPGQYQNTRYSCVFKDGKDGTAYDIEGKVFSNDGGETWFQSRDSFVDIEFPYNVPDKPEFIILKESENEQT